MVITKDEENKIRASIKTARSMKEAGKKLGYSRHEFRNRAVQLGLWDPVEKGLDPANKYNIQDLIEGKRKGSSSGLKKRLIEAGLLEDKCCKCGWSEKRPGYEYSTCHLDHIDGNEKNNKLNNLRVLCPNCHSLTSTYCIQKHRR